MAQIKKSPQQERGIGREKERERDGKMDVADVASNPQLIFFRSLFTSP